MKQRDRKSVLPPSLTLRRVRRGDQTPRRLWSWRFHMLEVRQAQSYLALARAVDKRVTMGALWGHFARAATIQLKRRMREAGMDPDAILAAAAAKSKKPRIMPDLDKPPSPPKR